MRPKQGRHFAARLREAEDVVDEQQRVGAGLVAEVLGHRQRREGDAEAGAGRLVHLAEHHARLVDDAAAGLADLGFLHFQPQVGPFAGPLADAGEHRVTAVRRLAMRAISSVRMTVLPRPAPPNRPALPPRTNGVSRSMTLMPVSNSSVLVDRSRERRRIAMDRPAFVGVDRAAAVDRLADQVEHAAERRLADGHGHGAAGVDALLAADQAVGAAQGDAAHAAAAQVLLHLAGEVDLHALVLGVDLHGVVDRRQLVLGELDVERRADDLRDVADVLGCLGAVAVAMVDIRYLVSVIRDRRQCRMSS